MNKKKLTAVIFISVLFLIVSGVSLLPDEADKTIALSEKIKSLCKEFRFEEALKEYENLSSILGVSVQAKSDSADHIINAIKNKIDAELKNIRKKADGIKQQQLKSLRKELGKRRKAALELILDESAYPEGDAGKAAQPKVNKKVDAVKEIWYNPAIKPADLPVDVCKTLEFLGRLGGYLKSLGIVTNTEEEISKLLCSVDRDEFRNLSLNNEEKSLAEHNKKIWEANENRVTIMNPDEMELLKKTNEYREMMGLKILGANDQLTKAARRHLEWCAKRNVIDHFQDIAESRTPQDMAGQEGYKNRVGENLQAKTAIGDNMQAVIDSWCGSSGHHRSMLRGWNEMGAGCVVSGDAYLAQVFGLADPSVLKYPKKDNKNGEKK